MNLPTIFIGLMIAALFVLAIRYLVRNGMCAACEDKKACRAAKKANASCQHCEQELQESDARHQASA